MDSYFLEYENRIPPSPVVKSKSRQQWFRVLAVAFITFGIVYLTWRMIYSLDHINTAFGITLFSAELLMFIGSILRVFNYWSYHDFQPTAPIQRLSEIQLFEVGTNDRPPSVDIFIPTINEDIELLRLTVEAAKQLEYPHRDLAIEIYLLDDGNRSEVAALADSEFVRYISRETNEGFKAGNINHAFNLTSGDLIVILDADTRVFPDFLKNTLGYFRDKKLAWVQTPQWYFDLTKNDILSSDPKMFYDAILRNKNAHNAVFSCGAGSIYRRKSIEAFAKGRKDTKEYPFYHHISEDVFNSMLMHADGHQSLYHHQPESKMLSPQDLSTWVKQQKRYASGAISMGLKKNALFQKGLSAWQKLHYFSIFYCYFTPLLILIYLLTPAISLSLNMPPFNLNGYSFFFFFVPFQVLNLVVFSLGNYGISTKRPDQKYWSSFWYVTQSWLKVLSGRKLLFNVTSKSRQSSNHFGLILPHLTVIIFSIVAIVIGAINLTSVPQHIGAYTLFAFWCLYNIYQLSAFVRAGFSK